MLPQSITKLYYTIGEVASMMDWKRMCCVTGKQSLKNSSRERIELAGEFIRPKTLRRGDNPGICCAWRSIPSRVRGAC